MVKILQKFLVLISILAILMALGCSDDKNQVSGPFRPRSIPGDVNLNKIANEVADAVLLSNYFLYGEQVFTIERESQIEATDVNRDGLTLSVADLVYITRIVIGDTLPFSITTPLEVRYTHDNLGVMSIKDDVLIGAVHLVMAGQDNPTLLADNTDLQYAYDGTNTSILLWSLEGNSFTGDFLNVTGEVVSLEMATYEGQPVNLILQEIQLEFALYQNEPNPFSDSTVIFFAFPRTVEASFIITDDDGLAVFKLHRRYGAGVSSIIWDGKDYFGKQLPNGVYYYSLIVEGKIKTREMILQR